MAVEEKNNKEIHESQNSVGESSSVSCVESRRFSNAGDATAEIISGFNDWSANISLHGMHMAYAVIAANWAVYGNAQSILSNPWAKYSVAIVILFLGLNLFCTWLMTKLYAERCDYADADKNRWADEFEKENTASSSWPYSKRIEKLGDFIRLIKVWVPIAGGIVFILGLLIGGQNSVGK